MSSRSSSKTTTGCPARRSRARFPAARWPSRWTPRWPSAAATVSLLTVGVATAVVVWQLHPSLLLANTTTTGGDTGAHIALPAYMKTHLLNHLRLTGWSPEWFAGFPAFTFYFPLPSLLIALGSYLIPYNIAFKLVTVLGSVALPIAAWSFGKLFGARRPIPECLAVASLPFLFDQTFTILGGNIASTMAGEYAFSLSLALALVFLGVMSKMMRTGRHQALAAILLALCALAHVVPALYAAAGAVVITLISPSIRRLRWSATVAVTSSALVAFWALPFIAELRYTSNMGWINVTNYVHQLFPEYRWWVLALAVIGLAGSIVWKEKVGLFLAIMAALALLGFRFAPQSKLYNARLLPLWVISEYLLAGVGFAFLGVAAILAWQRLSQSGRQSGQYPQCRLHPQCPQCSQYRQVTPLSPSSEQEVPGRAEPEPALPEPAWHGGGEGLVEPEPASASMPAADPVTSGLGDGRQAADRQAAEATTRGQHALRWSSTQRTRPGSIGVPLAALLLGCAAVLVPLTVGMPASLLTRDHGVPAPAKSFVSSWVNWNYSGYQGKPAYPEYRALMRTMTKVGKKYGCGRTMWEYSSSLERFGTTEALMLLPYWTHGCIDSMEGLLFESSATTPYHFINQAQLSAHPDYAMVGLPYPPLQVTQGIEHLQMLGVRYFMASSKVVRAAAAKDPALTLVARSGPWRYPPSYYGGTYTWNIYLVHGSSTVVGLHDQPVVARGLTAGGKTWQQASLAWYDDPARWNVLMAASGPKSWSRVSSYDLHPPVRPVRYTTVSHIITTSDTIHFTVDHVGSPVLVKTSFFPNWHATGARGPWRVTPNLMVVIPTSRTVVLRYGYTPVDAAGGTLTLLGVAGAALLAFRRRPRSRQRQRSRQRSRPRQRQSRYGHGARQAGASGPH